MKEKTMVDKISNNDIECKINESENEKVQLCKLPNKCFDLTKLPKTAIRQEMELYIRYRGQILKTSSLKSDLYYYNQFCKFLNDSEPHLHTFVGVDSVELERKCKIWLLKNGKNLTQKRIRTDTGRIRISDSEILQYLKKVIAFFNKADKKFNYDSEVWYLNGIPIEIKNNPTKKVESISFAKINQKKIREEIKKVIYIQLSQKALGTILAELS